MFRKLIALGVGAAILAPGPAAAFHGWFFCPPHYYYPPPVVYYYPVYVFPSVCPPAQPMTAPKERVPPKPMAVVETPPMKQKDDKSKGGVTPAEFRTDPPRTTELATPTPAPPPTVERTIEVPVPKRPADPIVPDLKAPTVTDRKTEPTPPSAPKTVDIPLPLNERTPTKREVPDVTIPNVKPTEPGKIPLLPVPNASQKSDAAPFGPGVLRQDPPTGTLQIPPIDIPPPAAGPEKKSVSKSSPLVNERVSPAVTVRSVTGPSPASGRFTVRFFNYTDSAFELTVETGSVSLPARHFVDVQIGRVFTWKAGTLPGRKTEIPADAAGLELEIRP